jgi:hypothetical protein
MLIEALRAGAFDRFKRIVRFHFNQGQVFISNQAKRHELVVVPSGYPFPDPRRNVHLHRYLLDILPLHHQASYKHERNIDLVTSELVIHNKLDFSGDSIRKGFVAISQDQSMVVMQLIYIPNPEGHKKHLLRWHFH